MARFARREFAPALRVAQPALRGPPPPSSAPSSILASSRLVADLYVHANGKVRLVDLAVPGGTTSPLLFDSWEEVFSEKRRERSENGNNSGGEEREDDIENGADDDASDAELSLPSSSEGEEDESEEGEGDDGGEETGTAGRAALPPSGGPTQSPRAVVRFRVVGGSRGAMAPGRSLYGAPHDFADGECVEALIERLRATEG